VRESRGIPAGVAITAAGTNVTLRGLTINGTGGAHGIRMTNGTELTVEDCAISNFLNDSDASAISIETGASVWHNRISEFGANSCATQSSPK
jgi:hypothetical protein